MKNEFRGTWKFMVTIFAAFALLTVFGGISVRILSTAENPGLLPVLTIILYVFSFIAVFFGLLIYLGNRYYKTMYSTQGYLTHTLPASETSIFSAKTLVSVIWMFAGALLMILSIFCLTDIGTEGEAHRELMRVFKQNDMVVRSDDSNITFHSDGIVIDDGETYVSITPGGIVVSDGSDTVRISGSGSVSIDDAYLKHPVRTVWACSIWFLINLFLGMTVTMLWIFASMAIGQLSDKHRTFYSILAGIGFYILNQILGIKYIIRLATTADILNSYTLFKQFVYGVPGALLISVAVLSAICVVINHKKLNLA